MSYNKKDIFLSIMLMIFFISFAIVFTVFFKQLYYFDIDYLNIDIISGIPAKIIKENYDIYYMVYQNGTWTDWAVNGIPAGQEGVGLRADGIRMSVTKKGQAPPAEPEKLPGPILPAGVDPSRPMVALTFDDGPKVSVTNRILNSLEACGGRPLEIPLALYDLVLDYIRENWAQFELFMGILQKNMGMDAGQLLSLPEMVLKVIGQADWRGLEHLEADERLAVMDLLFSAAGHALMAVFCEKLSSEESQHMQPSKKKA